MFSASATVSLFSFAHSATDFVYAQVESFFWYLCGQHHRAARIHPIEDCLLERGFVGTIVWNAAESVDLEYERVVGGLERCEELGV